MTNPARKSFAEAAFRLAQPLSAHLELTYACNWRCVFCYNPRHFDTTRMSAAEWLPVLDDLRALGTLNLTLTGGEPLAHPEFLEIARAVRSRGFALRVFSNASLITAEIASELAGMHARVEVSIHGATAETHDKTTAKPGSWDRMWRGIDLLRAAGVAVEAKSPVTNINEHELDDLIALARERRLPLRLDGTITAKDDGDSAPLSFTASLAARKRVIEVAVASGAKPQNRQTAEANCGVGRVLLAIDPTGNVFPCMQWRHSTLGNVRETPLRLLWKNSPIREEAAAASVAANTMLIERGGAASAFPYCPALAAQATGDPLIPDDGFLTRAELFEEVIASR
jgi:mycofactocin biosynthetic radical S-adenosylmethionine protein MftC